MIAGISDYVASIVILIMAMTVIELILPNHKNKKYVMFVCSLVLLLSVVNPILKVFGSNFDVNSQIQEFQKKLNEMENSSAANYDLKESIYDAYVNKLKKDMQERLEDMGYQVLQTEIQIDKYTYEPTKIEMQVQYQDGYIQPIVIDVFGDLSDSAELYDSDTNKIKQIMSDTYGVEKEKIKVNGI